MAHPSASVSSATFMPRHGGNLNHPRVRAGHLVRDTINDQVNPFKVPGLDLKQAQLILRSRDASMTQLSQLHSKLEAAGVDSAILQLAERCGWFIKPVRQHRTGGRLAAIAQTDAPSHHSPLIAASAGDAPAPLTTKKVATPAAKSSPADGYRAQVMEARAALQAARAAVGNDGDRTDVKRLRAQLAATRAAVKAARSSKEGALVQEHIGEKRLARQAERGASVGAKRASKIARDGGSTARSPSPAGDAASVPAAYVLARDGGSVDSPALSPRAKVLAAREAVRAARKGGNRSKLSERQAELKFAQAAAHAARATNRAASHNCVRAADNASEARTQVKVARIKGGASADAGAVSEARAKVREARAALKSARAAVATGAAGGNVVKLRADLAAAKEAAQATRLARRSAAAGGKRDVNGVRVKVGEVRAARQAARKEREAKRAARVSARSGGIGEVRTLRQAVRSERQAKRGAHVSARATGRAGKLDGDGQPTQIDPLRAPRVARAAGAMGTDIAKGNGTRVTGGDMRAARQALRIARQVKRAQCLARTTAAGNGAAADAV